MLAFFDCSHPKSLKERNLRPRHRSLRTIVEISRLSPYWQIEHTTRKNPVFGKVERLSRPQECLALDKGPRKLPRAPPGVRSIRKMLQLGEEGYEENYLLPYINYTSTNYKNTPLWIEACIKLHLPTPDHGICASALTTNSIPTSDHGMCESPPSIDLTYTSFHEFFSFPPRANSILIYFSLVAT